MVYIKLNNHRLLSAVIIQCLSRSGPNSYLVRGFNINNKKYVIKVLCFFCRFAVHARNKNKLLAKSHSALELAVLL